MGRESRRVPVDFDWPIGKTWDGYLLPDRLQADRCAECNGRGQTPAAQWLLACAQMILMLEDDLQEQQRGREMHPYFRDFYSTAYGTRPTKDISDVVEGLLGDRYRKPSPWSHDSIDGWCAYKAIVTAAGLDPDTWGICPTCEGHGEIEEYPGQRQEAEQWEPTDPPTGDGWQMWETTSEGSPTSPVFKTPEELATWCVTGTTVFGSARGTYEQWFGIITGADFAHVQIAPGVVIM